MTPRAVSSAAALRLARMFLATPLFLTVPVEVRFEVQPAGFVHAPIILLQPGDRTIFAGQNATFSVSIHGTAPLVYQWQFNDADLPGANASVLTLSKATTNQAGGYSVVVTNSAGSVTSTVATLVVNRIPDNTLPTVAITAPAANARLTNPSITLQGTASDNLALDRVEVQSGTDPFQTATGTTSWSAPLTLNLGTNVLRVRAIDSAGNESTLVERRLVHVASSPLTLILNGPGAVSGATNGQWLELGRNYTLTATPAPGHVFSNWTGALESTSNKLAFLMQSNLAFTANFVPNPFLLTKGVYHGLFHESDAVRVARSGSLTLTLTVQGAFSGAVSAGAQRWAVLGRFGVDGQATNDVARRGTNALRLELQLTGTDQITGKIRDPVHWEADLLLDRAVFHPRTNRAPWSGTYTLIIPGWSGDATLPCGDGFGGVTIDAGGNVRLAGTLADGTKLAQRSVLSGQGHWPLFAPLYRGQGAVLSWVQFDTNALGTDLAGNLSWIKPSVGTAKLYPGGFTNEATLHGSRWALPAATERFLQFTNGMMLFEEGGLPGPLTNYFILGLGGRLTNSGAASFRFKLAPRSGLFSGTTAEPTTSRSVLFRGALQQKCHSGSGHFLGTNQSGHLHLQAAP